MELYFQFGTSDNVDAPLGYVLLDHNLAVTKVTESLTIPPERNFGYYNKRYEAALNSGVISQSVYDDIIAEQGGSRVIFEIEEDSQVSGAALLALVANYGIQNVDTGGTTPEIVEDIINEGYQIIKKL